MPVSVAVAVMVMVVMESAMWSARWKTGGWKKAIGSSVDVVVRVKME